MATISAHEVRYDPYDVEINADPYPVFRRLRDEAPLYYNEQHDFYAVSRYDDVEAGLVDAATYISSRGAILELIKANLPLPAGTLIFEDPPLHSIHRSLLSRVFTPKKMAALEPTVRAFCARCLDPLVGTGRFDFVADLGAQMPMRTIGLLLGIPEQDQASIRDHVDATLRTEAGRPMSSSVDIALSGELFADYIDWRAEHPAEWEKLRTRPELLPDAVEEILRWVSPISHFTRTATGDYELRGRTIHTGDQVALYFASANRDEDVFDDPFGFSVDRRPNPHLAFGFGEHFCMGAHLARLEITTIFGHLLRRLSSFEVSGSVERLSSIINGSIKRLPLRYRTR